MPESGTYEGEAVVENASEAVACLIVPENASGKNIHVICEVEDDGTPALTSYRRVVINVR